MSEDLRQRYEAEVAALCDAVAERLSAGQDEESVARWVVAERNALKDRYRALTPPGVLARILANNVRSYGAEDGPSVDQLRARGRSWAEITASATRPGRHGEVFFLGERIS